MKTLCLLFTLCTASQATWVRCFIGLTLFTASAVAKVRAADALSVKEKFSISAVSDLRVLERKVPHYKVEKVPSLVALQTLWKLALGHDPELLEFRLESEDLREVVPSSVGSITLDLHDIAVREIVGYIAELSGCRWRFEGSSAWTISLVLEQLVVSRCKEPVQVIVLSVPASVAEGLGLSPGQSPAKVMQVLRGYGVMFNDERADVAAYDSEAGVITMIGSASETALVSSLVRLLRNGMTVEKKQK